MTTETPIQTAAATRGDVLGEYRNLITTGMSRTGSIQRIYDLGTLLGKTADEITADARGIGGINPQSLTRRYQPARKQTL